MPLTLKVYDDEEREEPGEQDELRGAVGEGHLDGVAAAFVNDGELQVAQDGEDDEDGGEIELVGAELGDDVGRYGVHHVAHEHHGGCDGYRLVDEGEVVAAGVLARGASRLVHLQHVVAALGEGEEEGEQEGHEHYPLAELHARGIAAGKDAEHEARGDDAHVDDGVFLQPQAVGDVQHEVGGDDADGPPLPEHEHERGRRCHRHRHHRVCLRYGNRARGYRAVALHGVRPVSLDVDDVVEAVYRRGCEAERHEGERHHHDVACVEQSAAEEDGQEHEDVLYPVARARHLDYMPNVHCLYLLISWSMLTRWCSSHARTQDTASTARVVSQYPRW